MKKIIITILSIIMTLCLCSCGGSVKTSAVVPVSIIEAIPTSILTLENVQAVVNYIPVLDGEVKKDANKSTALYRSEPIGKGDIVKVTVIQYLDTVTKEQVKAEFDDIKSKRPKAITVERIDNCFIAYPSIHFYKDGYHIQITAGSGNDDTQKALLEKLANVGLMNLNNLLTSKTK